MRAAERQSVRSAVAVLATTVAVVSAVVRGPLPPAVAIVGVLALVGGTVYLRSHDQFSALAPNRRTDAATLMVAVMAFLSATPSLRLGNLELSDLVFLALFPVLLFRQRRPPSDDVPIVGLLGTGVGLLVCGGLIGGLFPPGTRVFRAEFGYVGSSLWLLPPSVADLVRFAAVSAGMLLLLRLWRPDQHGRRLLALAFGLGALASVVDGVVQGGDRAQGLTPHPVFYGLISAAAVLVGIGLFAGENGALRIVGALVAIGGVIGVLGSGTRAAALILGLSVLFFAVASRSAKVVGALVGAALVALLFTVVAGSRLSDTPTVVRLRGGGYARLSTQGRSALRDDTLALIRRRGVTGAGFRYLVPAHNLLLGVIGATGVIGLSGFVLIVCRLGQRLAVVPRADPLAIAALSAVLAFFAASWVVNGGWDRWLWLLIATFGTVRWDSATGGA